MTLLAGFGRHALVALTTGSKNSRYYDAALNVTTGDNNLLLGKNAGLWP